MDFNAFAETIKTKYPQYKDKDNRTLAEAIVKKHPQYAEKVTFDAPAEPKFYELEKQPGTPEGPLAKVKQVGQQFLEGAMSPVPGSLITTPLRAASETAGQLGSTVAKKMVEGGSEPTTARVAGYGAALLTDPLTFVAGPEMALVRGAFSGIKKAGSGILKTVMKLGANVSDSSIEQGAKAGWKLPKPSPADIEIGVQSVQNALKSAVDDAGKFLNDAKSKIGLPTTVAEKEAAVKNFGNIYGLAKEEGALAAPYLAKPKAPEDLVKTIISLKEKGASMPTKLKAKIATYLQDQINGFVDWEKSGNQTQGLLKQQYKQLGDIIQKEMPKEIRERMSRALSLKDDLEKQLGMTDTEGAGRGERFLRSLFEGKSPRSKDYLKRLADLEALTGEPVLQSLFKMFAGEDFSKLAGRPFIAYTGGTSAMAGLASGNPLPAVIGGALVAGQSPRFLAATGRLSGAAADAAERLSVVPARAARGFGMSAQNREELNRTLERLKRGKSNAK